MRSEGGFVVAVDAAAVVDPTVGAFDHPASGLDGEAVVGFRPGNHLHGDIRLGRGGGDDLAGVAVVHPHAISRRGGRWWIFVNVEAADLHPAHQHPASDPAGHARWVGVDRGLSAFLVAATADGTEVARISDAPKALAAGMKQQRRLSKSLSRKKKGSHNRTDAAARLGRHHHRVADMRRHFLHQVSGELVKTHDRLVIENLNVAGMLANHHLARAISDAGWSEFARMLRYKQAWRGGRLVEADRWYPSTRLCPQCGAVDSAMTLADRVFSCGCGHTADRDTNAATNLARAKPSDVV